MKIAVALSIALFVAAFGFTPALAQSSGSFNYNADTTACTDIGGLLGGGASVTSLKTTMKVSSGNGLALVGIMVTWTPTTNFTAPNKAMACVGPVVVTTEQVKMFNQSLGIAF